jgi:hypothetical protein
MMLLDTGITVDAVIAELKDQREAWCPKFKIENMDDAIALINVFGAFK